MRGPHAVEGPAVVRVPDDDGVRGAVVDVLPESTDASGRVHGRKRTPMGADVEKLLPDHGCLRPRTIAVVQTSSSG
ncbi:hypothetical protein [Pendulispora albinea]|uniref:Uncharacterized protein n=1 Tax=Pendulispora albinea TaxID=2741071 RepID=A0ABZ2M1U3_9BACT